ncbi:MAG: 50S ribosomal protein L15 [Muribaculaceae bacterium]|nr:50S ribosomal protein L15 [Muribaculaceae bacterium]
MELHNLHPAVGSNKKKRRIGRGPGSGKGGTSTRGHKGAKSRSGYKQKIGFEGGQMPLQRRLPKYGFKNINRVEYKAVNIMTIDALAEKAGLEKVTVADLVNAGLVRSKQLVKVLGMGELSRKIDVEAHAFSKKAEEIITAAGGQITKV